uniref:Uncharacterized protein n=1 Tax=Anguilla anguilla TaxID=7936 RepID=A0A0E9QW96_ANGAN
MSATLKSHTKHLSKWTSPIPCTKTGEQDPVSG